ncbi:WSC domain-containing protein 2 [Armadillidium vulgare]|nr:WSC domain-containing protein 2 [Armadillidium vulgare]
MKVNGGEKVVLWKRDEKCKKFDVRFGKRFKFQYLASFPGSGNTWTRYLIEAATGIFTGSVFKDNTLFKLGFLGEREKMGSGKMMVIKTHGSLWSKTSDLHNTSVPVCIDHTTH